MAAGYSPLPAGSARVATISARVPGTSRKYHNLDILRAMAVSYVFINHLTLMLWPTGRRAEISGAFGRFGVILFFVHTSLVLMQSMETLSSKTASWRSQFYIRRLFRIYPLAIVAVLVAAFGGMYYAPWTTTGLWANLLLIQNLFRIPPMIGPLWTLPIEVQMYLLLPFIFVSVQKGNWQRRIFFMVLAAAMVAGLVYARTGRLNFFAFPGCFLAGTTAYKLRSTSRPYLSGWIWIAAILACTALGVIYTLWIPVEWAVCFVLAWVFSVTKEIPVRPIALAGEKIAQYSYGIYLANAFGAWYGERLFHTAGIAAGLAAATVITIVAAILSYHIIEEPFIRLGKSVSERLGAPGRAALQQTA